MPETNRLPQKQVVRRIAQSERRTFTLFLGAGASVSSGIPLASAMIQEWRRTAYDERGDNSGLDTWLAGQPWFGKFNEYSQLFELVYEDELARQRYIEKKIDGVFPNWGYLYLANVLQKRFAACFTTNFDDLIRDALVSYTGYAPAVCWADAQVASLNLYSDRITIIKLHGDYLFRQLKNTDSELDSLDANMRSKFEYFAEESGMVVIGYAGNDKSVMSVIEHLLATNQRAYQNGIYWGLRAADRPPDSVHLLAEKFPNRFRLFELSDFDSFMADLHKELELDLPATLNQAMQERFRRLVAADAEGQAVSGVIREDRQAIRDRLKLPWNNTSDTSELALLHAQLELGRGNHHAALEILAGYPFKNDASDCSALNVWALALEAQGEAEKSQALGDQAVEKWKQAIALNPNERPPHYNLARHYWRAQKLAECMVECEILARLSPEERIPREQLVQVYGTLGRLDDAQKELDWLLERYPQEANYHASQAMICEQEGRLMEALESVRTAIRLAPAQAAFHLAAANCLVKLNRPDEAAVEFEDAIQLAPDNVANRLQIGMFYMSWMRPALAIPHLRHAVDREPLSLEARGWLGEAYLTLGQLTDAQTQIEESLKLSPNDKRAHLNMGILCIAQGRAEPAEAHLRTTIQLDPRFTKAYVYLTGLYHGQKREAERDQTLHAFEQIDPGQANMMRAQLGLSKPGSTLKSFARSLFS